MTDLEKLDQLVVDAVVAYLGFLEIIQNDLMALVSEYEKDAGSATVNKLLCTIMAFEKVTGKVIDQPSVKARFKARLGGGT